MSFTLTLRFQRAQPVTHDFKSLSGGLEVVQIISQLPLDPPLIHLELKKIQREKKVPDWLKTA